MRTHDRDFINRLFEAIGFTPPSYTFLRLGKQSGSGTRPIKVMFASADLAVDLFKKFSRSPPTEDDLPNVSISRDRTLRERKYLNDVRKQLEERRGEGETDLTIKFINDIPTIVKQSKN